MLTLLPHSVHLNLRTRLPRRDWRDVPRIWTPAQAYVWEKAVFTVPIETSEERVQAAAPRYKKRFGEYLETEGFRIVEFDGPCQDKTVVAAGITEPDRRRYVLWAKVTRRPREVRVDVPDEDVEIYQRSGFKLA